MPIASRFHEEFMQQEIYHIIYFISNIHLSIILFFIVDLRNVKNIVEQLRHSIIHVWPSIGTYKHTYYNKLP